MFYWNQSNFEGLKSIGEEYASKNGYEDFSNYCLFKEKGLKKQANQYINDFVSKIRAWPIEKKRELSQELTSLWFWHQNTHQLLSHPLEQFIIKTLEEWCLSEPNNASAHKWLGCMGGGIEHFEKALEIDNTDEISISRLIQDQIDDADYITHHLSESRLLGTEAELATAIIKARNYACMLSTQELKDNLLNEIDYYSDLAQAWKQYNGKRQPISFTEWAESQGKNFSFCSIVYYDK